MTKKVIPKRLWYFGIVYEAELLSGMSRVRGNWLDMKKLQVKHQRLVSICTFSSTILSGDRIDLINLTPQMIPVG